MPMLRSKYRRILRRAKYAPLNGTKKFKTIVLNFQTNYGEIESLSGAKPETYIKIFKPFGMASWLPEKTNIAYDANTTFECYEQCRLKCVYIEFRNFNVRLLKKYSDDSVDDETFEKMVIQYIWDSNDMLGGNNLATRLGSNWNKLNKKKVIYRNTIKPNFTYKYVPKYPNNEGWCEFQNSDGYGTYDALYDLYNDSFPLFIRKVCSKPVIRFKVPEGSSAGIVDQPQFMPVFYFNHETEYAPDQYDTNRAVFIKNIGVHTNFEVSIKSVWEFKNPRIDPIDKIVPSARSNVPEGTAG